MSCNCGPLPIFPYRVVQNLKERNSLPCSERMRGMKVVVIQGVVGTGTPPYTEYMMQGNDPCNNDNWRKITVDNVVLENTVGHVTLESLDETPISNTYLNNRYPSTLEGFRVTILPLNTTFMKISNGRWVMTNNILSNG